MASEDVPTVTKTYRVTHTDDYRTGPHLYSTEILSDEERSEGSEENEGDEDGVNTYEIELEVSQKARVYHLLLYIGDYDARFCAEFDQIEDAELYAGQQYFLYTGDYPFIVTGMTSAYKSKGERIKIPVPETMQCDLEEPDYGDCAYEYILIVSTEHFSAHSLNPFAEW